MLQWWVAGAADGARTGLRCGEGDGEWRGRHSAGGNGGLAARELPPPKPKAKVTAAEACAEGGGRGQPPWRGGGRGRARRACIAARLQPRKPLPLSLAGLPCAERARALPPPLRMGVRSWSRTRQRAGRSGLGRTCRCPAPALLPRGQGGERPVAWFRACRRDGGLEDDRMEERMGWRIREDDVGRAAKLFCGGAEYKHKRHWHG